MPETTPTNQLFGIPCEPDAMYEVKAIFYVKDPQAFMATLNAKFEYGKGPAGAEIEELDPEKHAFLGFWGYDENKDAGTKPS